MRVVVVATVGEPLHPASTYCKAQRSRPLLFWRGESYQADVGFGVGA